MESQSLMDSSTKSKVVKGFKWSSAQSFITQALQFVISIIIARQLLPSDYGILGMLAIFIGISSTFLNSGFGSALIQKKEATQVDFSTAFYFNVGMGVFLYLLLFFFAPLIADFYDQPILVSVTRVYLVTLVINALNISQRARLSRRLDFKTGAVITIISLVISGIVGIWLAYSGYGVWALVWQGIASAASYSIILWIKERWLPSLVFSKESFNALFGFGCKILGSSLINSIYSNISTLIIGKAFNASDLGYFSRAQNFSVLPGNTLTNIVVGVNYPVLSRYQDDNTQLLANYKVLMRMPVFILFPILFGMATLAYPMIGVLIGSKWLESAPMIMILCVGCLWQPLTHINLNLLYVKGRTDLVLRLELIKKPIAFLMLFGAIPFGIYGMCVSIALYDFVAFCFNCYYTHKILNYGFWKQMKELLPILGYSTFMALVVLAVTFTLHSDIMKLVMGIPIGAISYYLISRLFHDQSLMTLRKMIVARISWSSYILK